MLLYLSVVTTRRFSVASRSLSNKRQISRSRLKNDGEIREFKLFVNKIHLVECIHCMCEGV